MTARRFLLLPLLLLLPWSVFCAVGPPFGRVRLSPSLGKQRLGVDTLTSTSDDGNSRRSSSSRSSSKESTETISRALLGEDKNARRRRRQRQQQQQQQQQQHRQNALSLRGHLRRRRRRRRGCHDGGQNPVARATYFWIRAGPIVFHYKLTQGWLALTKAKRKRRDRVYNKLHDRYCRPSLDLILRLKGLYVKMGQVLSARSDCMPRQYVELFTSLQDSLPQMPFEMSSRVIRDSLESTLGRIWEDVFESMDPIALGAASIGQCHRAVLTEDCYGEWKDAGYMGNRVVAVKVMHPHARSQFTCDFAVFRWLCRIALPGWGKMLNEIERQMMKEFDYRREAENLDRVRLNMAVPFSNRVKLPQPIRGLCTERILVMEYLEGKKLSESFEDRLASIMGDEGKARALIQKRREAFMYGEESDASRTFGDVGMMMVGGGAESEDDDEDDDDDCPPSKPGFVQRFATMFQLIMLANHIARRVDLLCDIHGQQIFVDGIFNGDPHPGNFLQLPSGKIGLIDFGQTKTLSDEERLLVARIVTELGRDPSSRDTAVIAQAMRQCGFRTARDRDDVLEKYARLFFDSDADSRRCGYSNPQLYLMHLTDTDPLESVPSCAILVARVSFMFRGVGSMISYRVETSKRWRKHAERALAATE